MDQSSARFNRLRGVVALGAAIGVCLGWWLLTRSFLPLFVILVLVVAGLVAFVVWSGRAGSVAHAQERVEAGIRKSFPSDPGRPRM